MDLYSEIILDHFKNPRKRGSLSKPTISAQEVNPSCGDELRIDLQIENGQIIDAAFDGRGCAISQAAASMLLDEIIGQPITKIATIDNEKMYDLLGVPISPGRVKCALMALVTAKKAAILASAPTEKIHATN